jgi:endoribonuclease Nob1
LLLLQVSSMKAILDSSVFFSDLPITGELYTTPSVCDELIDIRSKGKFEKFSAEGLRIISPSAQSREKVTIAAKKTRDTSVISDTDCELLALALELDAVLYTDDFAIQNVAGVLGVQTMPISQRKAKRIHWKYRCSGCGRYFDHIGDCLICGSIIKRKLK